MGTNDKPQGWRMVRAFKSLHITRILLSEYVISVAPRLTKAQSRIRSFATDRQAETANFFSTLVRVARPLARLGVLWRVFADHGLVRWVRAI